MSFCRLLDASLLYHPQMICYGILRKITYHGKMDTQNLQFIQCLPVSGSGSYIPAKVTEATEGHAKWWAMHVQESVRNDETRPDRNWNWINIVKGSHPLIALARRLGQRPKTFCILAVDGSGSEVPLAMILLVERYPFLPNNAKEAPFLWFLAAAPGGIMRQHLANQRPSMLQALIDVGIVFSFKEQYEGRLCLHSDPIGGVDLQNKYAGCGLQKLPEEVRLPLSRELLRNLDDSASDAYFYADTDHAHSILQRSHHLRTYPPAIGQ